jgi:hypothetical protein
MFFLLYFPAKRQQPEQQQNNSNNQSQGKRQHQFSETARIYSALVVLCICYSIGMLNNLAALAINWQWVFTNLLSPEGYAQISNIYILTLSLVNLCYTPLLFMFRYSLVY